MRIKINNQGKVTEPKEIKGAYIIIGVRDICAEFLNEIQGTKTYDCYSKMTVNVELKHFKGALSLNRVPGYPKSDYSYYDTKLGQTAFCNEKLKTFFGGKIPRRIYILPEAPKKDEKKVLTRNKN